MKHAMGALAILAAAAGTAWAQEGEGPRRDFERRVRELEERFRAQKEQLEREFRERMQPRRLEPRAEHDGVHALLERVLERLDRLEKKLDEVRPKFQFDFKDLERRFEGARPPKLEFDFERLERFIPRFRQFFDKDGDFDFEFFRGPRSGHDFREQLRKKVEEELEKRRRAGKKHEDRSEHEPAPEKPGKKKDKDDGGEKKEGAERPRRPGPPSRRDGF